MWVHVSKIAVIHVPALARHALIRTQRKGGRLSSDTVNLREDLQKCNCKDLRKFNCEDLHRWAAFICTIPRKFGGYCNLGRFRFVESNAVVVSILLKNASRGRWTKCKNGPLSTCEVLFAWKFCAFLVLKTNTAVLLIRPDIVRVVTNWMKIPVFALNLKFLSTSVL